MDEKVVKVRSAKVGATKSNIGQKTITLDEAKKIALDDAGVLNKDAEFNQAVFCSRDFNEYFCDFKSGEDKYCYIIDAATGDILYFAKYYE